MENATKFWFFLQSLSGKCPYPPLPTRRFPALGLWPGNSAPLLRPDPPPNLGPHAASGSCESNSSSLIGSRSCNKELTALGLDDSISFTFAISVLRASRISRCSSTFPFPALTSLPFGGEPSLSPSLKLANWPSSLHHTNLPPSYHLPSRCWIISFSPSLSLIFLLPPPSMVSALTAQPPLHCSPLHRTSASPPQRTVALAVSFSKAFDTAPYLSLLQRLTSTTLSSNLLHWLTSYLRGRTECCQLHSAWSGTRGVRRCYDIEAHQFA